MTYRVLTLIVLLSLLCPTVNAQEMLCIMEPKGGDAVSHTPIVKGKVQDLSSTIWVVVHPLGTNEYWVQPKVAQKTEGEWDVRIYIGRPGSVDIGKRFRIMAVANPEQALKEGDVFQAWPKAQWQSQIVEVTRK